MKALRLLTVVGARPQFVKAAAMSRAIEAYRGIADILVHHRAAFRAEPVARVFRRVADPAPRVNLGIYGGSHGEMTGRMLEALEKIMVAEAPDMVIVRSPAHWLRQSFICRLPISKQGCAPSIATCRRRSIE